MIKELLTRLKTRSIVVCLLTCGAIGLAIYDSSFRPTFGNIVSTGLGGYLAQLLPESRH